ncbi:MAG: carboxypeptidase regulatory-like domain-containing protein [Planctomycetota bacterium]|nr:MAG: carboxypeptidase regulatory-like domain-containing protein [Planctomycetota bacterium]
MPLTLAWSLDGEQRETEGSTDLWGRWWLDLKVGALVQAVIAKGFESAGPAWSNPRYRVLEDETCEVSLSAPAPLRIVGAVVDERGGARPGAEVRVYDAGPVQAATRKRSQPLAVLRCDAAGRFQLDGARLPLLLATAAPGEVGSRLCLRPSPETTDAEALPGGPLEVELRLYPERTVTVRVVDDAGLPVPDAEVRFHSAEAYSPASFSSSRPWLQPLGTPAESARTSADGVVALHGLACAAYRVTVVHPRFPPWTSRLEPAAGELRAVLKRGLELSGRVVTSSGAPVAGACVALQTRGPFQFCSTLTDAQGGFRFEALYAAERTIVRATAPGHGPGRVEDARIDAAAAPLELVLPAGLSLAGCIRDELGTPVASARVEIRREDGAREEGELPLVEDGFGTCTGADGRFAIPDLPAGTYRVSVEAPGGPQMRTVVRGQAGGPALSITLGRSELSFAGVTGVVRDGLSGEPVLDYLVLVERQEEDHAGVPRLQYERDRFHVSDLEAGRWILRVRAPGYAEWRSEGLELGGGVRALLVDLLPWRTLRVRVLDVHQAPVTRALLRVRDRDGRRGLMREGEGAAAWVTGLRTDERGMADMLDVPGGPVVLEVQPPHLSGPFEYAVDLTFPLDVRQDITLPLDLSSPRRELRIAVYEGEPGVSWDGAPPPGALPLASACRVAAYDARGELVAELSLEPRSDSWSWRSGSLSGWCPDPEAALSLPCGACRVQVAAAGRAPVALDVPAGDAAARVAVTMLPR